MKTILLLLTISVLTFRTVRHLDNAPGYNELSDREGGTDTAQSSSPKLHPEISEESARFICTVTRACEFQIERSKTAANLSANQHIKLLAKKIIHDQQRLLSQLRELAKEKSTGAPLTKDSAQDTATRIIHFENERWDDSAWINDLLASEQRKMIEFLVQTTLSDNSTILVVLRNAIPGIEQHIKALEHLSKILQEKSDGS